MSRREEAEAHARRIAAILRTRRDRILDRWISLVLDDERVPHAREISREELLDFVPVLLDQVISALEVLDPSVNPVVAGNDDVALSAAIRHADHRFEQGYTLAEVIRELAHFRAALSESCEDAETPLGGPAGRLAHALIDHAIGGGAETIERNQRARAVCEKKEAERIAAVKDAFLSRVSHELRTPLNVILGWAQLLRARPNLDPQVGSALATMERNAILQARLVDDLLDLARMRNKKMSLLLRPVDPLAALRAAIESSRPMAASKQIELEAKISPGVLQMSGDFDRLHQIFTNLLDNAVKFTSPGGRVVVSARYDAGRVRVCVQDTGVGIEPHVLPTLFDEYRQADPQAGARARGLGLGLAIVRELAELHGGRAYAESDGLGHGSTFFVELPATLELAAHPRA